MLVSARRRRPDAARGPSEGGFTLIELLIASVLGIVVLLAAFALLDNAGRYSSNTRGRVDAAQRGRLAVGEVTRMLRSQVCLGSAITPIVDARPDTVSFYANLGTVDAIPQIRRFAIGSGTLTETDFDGTGPPPATTFTNYPSTPSRTRPLLDEVSQTGATPYFTYYGFTAPPAPGEVATPTVELVPDATGTLTAADRGRVVRIDVNLTTSPGPSFVSGAGGSGQIVLQDSVLTRLADPYLGGGPQCQ